MILIILSSLKLVFDTYIPDDNSNELMILSDDLNLFFNCCFLVEMILKIVTLGFIADDDTYLSDGWSVLDFFIVVTSFIDYIF